MAKYTVTYRCGHKGEVQICGPQKDRQGKADYEATKLCKTCWQADQDASRAAANAEAAEAAQTAGRPELQGTEKQVAWATTIRENKALEFATAQVNAAKAGPECAGIFEAIAGRILAQTAASWWIDRRDETATRLLRAEATETELARLTEIAAAVKAAQA